MFSPFTFWKRGGTYMGCTTSIDPYGLARREEKPGKNAQKFFVNKELFCNWCGIGTRKIAISKDGKVIPCCDECVPPGVKLEWLDRTEMVYIISRDEGDNGEDYEDEEIFHQEFLPEPTAINGKARDFQGEAFAMFVKQMEEKEQDVFTAEVKNREIREKRVSRIAQKIQNSPEFEEHEDGV